MEKKEEKYKTMPENKNKDKNTNKWEKTGKNWTNYKQSNSTTNKEKGIKSLIATQGQSIMRF